MLFPKKFLFSCILLWTAGRLAADSFVFDPTTSSRTDLPPWLTSRPLASPKEQAELTFTITPLNADLDLAVTVVFKEELDGYLAVYWQGATGPRQQLSANLSEYIGLPNQRTLLINRPTMGGPGTLILQSKTRSLNILRVRLDWVRPGVVRLVDSVPNGALITTGGKMFAPEEVDGKPLTAIADTWEGRILSTSITETAQRIEQGVGFPVAVPGPVKRARVEVLVSGLALDQSFKMWLNGNLLGSLAMEVPDLADVGYNHAGSVDSYAGWRKGTLLVPRDQLIQGDNLFVFEAPAGSAIAIRDFLLQVQYGAF